MANAKERLKVLLDQAYQQIEIIERVLRSRPGNKVGPTDLEQLHNLRMRLEDKWIDLQEAEKLLSEKDVESLYGIAMISGEEALRQINEDVNRLLPYEKDASS